jgi:hypothetical protein
MEEFYRIVRELFAREPELASECDKLFLCEDSPY